MKGYTNFNMGSESSANNDINNTVLKKKKLDGIDLDIDNSKKEEPIKQKDEENVKLIGKEEFKQTDPNYHSGILERKEVDEKVKPSVLIIFIIILVIFFGEVIYYSIFK